MSLTSTSTLAEVQAAYDDNCDYDLAASATKARLFIQACRILARRYTEQQSTGSRSMGLRENLMQIQSAMQRAETWLQANGGNDSTGGVKYLSFEEFRN